MVKKKPLDWSMNTFKELQIVLFGSTSADSRYSQVPNINEQAGAELCQAQFNLGLVKLSLA